MGRPSIYSLELAATICQRLAEKESLRAICRDPAMPSRAIVMRWLRNNTHPEFVDHYARGRKCGLDAMADEILEIADQLLPPLRNGRIDRGRVQQQRLQIDARKWIMSKQVAKKYGASTHERRLSLTVVTEGSHPDDSSSEASRERPPCVIL